MTRSVLPSLAAGALTALAACADSPVQPPSPEAPGASLAVNSGPSASGRFVVDFNGQLRGDFAARVAALGGTVEYIAANAGFAGVSGLSAQAAAALGKAPGVSAVFDDVAVQINSAVSVGEIAAVDVGPTSVANPAGGFRFNYQWNMRAIGANTAWAAGALGAQNVTAAILDSGIDYDSYDMAGIVDLTRSASFVSTDNTILNAFFPGRNPLDDLNGHGTNVATQVSSNATIFAGVNSRAKLIGVKVLGANGSGSIGGILAGIIWAADHGADVANMSIGIPKGVDKAGNGLFVGLTNRVFNYANRKGMILVVSSGNDGQNLDNNGRSFAAYCEAPHVVCVSATGPTASTNAFSGPWTNVDAGASYSNTGRQSVTVSAPGGTSRGWVASVCARHAAAVSGNTIVFPCNAPPGFFSSIGMAGTSQAAPHVTGVIAQMIAKYGRMQPSQMKQLLLDSLDDLGPPGPDDVYGAGRVNLVKALSH